VAGGFLATNIDNLLLMVGWMIGGGTPHRHILGGYVLATAGVLGVSLLLGLSSGQLPVEYIGYLGLVPILLGARVLLARLRHGPVAMAGNVTMQAGSAGVATTLFSNSVDTILVISPLLGDTHSRFDMVIVVAYLAVACVWFALAYILHARTVRLKWLSSKAQWVAPLIMITVGLYILDNTLTDMIAGH